MDDIRVSVACRMKKYLSPLSKATVSRMCESGTFKTAHKKGMGKNSPWYISGSEIIQYKLNRYATLRQ
jgi:hypothetical protein